MLETFLPMRTWLERCSEPVTAIVETPLESEPEQEPEWKAWLERADIDDAIDEAKRFRALLADAVSCCVDDLLIDIAGDILARELLLAPCDVRAIVDRAIARYGVDPVRIRVHPEDARLLETMDVSVVADDSLRAGDAVIETRYGSIDASLGVRLARVLERSR